MVFNFEFSRRSHVIDIRSKCFPVTLIYFLVALVCSNADKPSHAIIRLGETLSGIIMFETMEAMPNCPPSLLR